MLSPMGAAKHMNERDYYPHDVEESTLAAREAILNAQLLDEYNLCGDINMTKRVQALAERGLENPVVLVDD